MPGEDTTGQSNAGAAPAGTPALTAEDIQKIVATQVEEATEKRVRGLQSSYETQLAGLRTELAAATADPDQYDASASSKLEAELAEARRESEALRAARQYPEVFPTYEALLAAKSPVAQLDILQAYVQGSTPAPAQAPQAPTAPGAAPAEVPVVPPPVDPNNPVQAPAGTPFGVAPEQMDQGLADRIIDSIGPIWPKA